MGGRWSSGGGVLLSGHLAGSLLILLLLGHLAGDGGPVAGGGAHLLQQREVRR